MATWTVHLRIAQKFIDSLDFLDKKEFIAGSLAPDCGYKIAERTFSPPPMVTHFSKTGMKNDCNYKDFAKKYLLCAKTNKERSFYLGYYIHLLTDILWSFIIYVPTYDMYGTDQKQNPELIKKIRADWSLIDAKFYCSNTDFEAFKIMHYYERQKSNPPKTMPKFISEEKVNNFISSAFETIYMDLKNKNYDKPMRRVLKDSNFKG